MPTKHINDELWKRIEERTINVIVTTQSLVKDSDILQAVILKGLEASTTEELAQYILRKRDQN